MPVVLQAPPNPALEVLAELGGTAEAIAASLARLGVTGNRDSCSRCPIAIYLLDRLGLRDVAVSELEIELFLPDGDVETVETPKPIADFIVGFDDCQFTGLVATHQLGGAS